MKRGQPDVAGEPASPEPSTQESGDDYDVGYKKPPRHSQFKRGQSGNKKGRPKSQKNLKTELLEEMSEPITVREDGKRRTISKIRAVIKGQIAKAIKGDTKAAKFLTDMASRLIPQDDEPVEDENVSAEDHAILEALEDRIRRKLEARKSVRRKKGKKT
jgi:hypothetical protein